MQLVTLLLSLALLLPPHQARTPRNCGLACNSVKKCLVTIDHIEGLDMCWISSCVNSTNLVFIPAAKQGIDGSA